MPYPHIYLNINPYVKNINDTYKNTIIPNINNCII